MSTADSRRHPRIEVVLKVTYASQDDLMSDYTHNASAGGLFIATDKDFMIGETLSLELSFPGLLSPVACRGVVRWRRTPAEISEENPPGVGIEFAFKDEAEARPVMDLFERLSRTVARAESAPVEAESAPPQGPFRALLVEDNPLVREMLIFAVRKFHQSRGGSGRELELAEADNGQVACERLEGQSFDIAIVDTVMPVMDGFRLLKWIRASDQHRELPVIMVTTGGKDERPEAEQAGADLVVDKPLVLNKLLQSMQQLLDMNSAGEG